MNTRQMIVAVIGTVLKVALAVAVIVFVYKGALFAYDFGYRVFSEPAMTKEGEGWDVTVEVTMGKSALQVGELLQEKGLIRDAKLFYVQNLLSEYKDQLRAGIYTLNTSMTAKEMMRIMSAVPAEDEAPKETGS